MVWRYKSEGYYMAKIVVTLICALLSFVPSSLMGQSNKDAELLGKALDYFNSAKYHEALLNFQTLDRDYNLNSRFKAYIGLCYYKEWEFEKAVEYFSAALSHLNLYSPQERSVYFYAAAESFFHLQKYQKAIPLYKSTLELCNPNEKPDNYYKLGLAEMFLEHWKAAYDNFQLAIKSYEQQNIGNLSKQRLAQLQRMSMACKEKIEDKKLTNSKDKSLQTTTESIYSSTNKNINTTDLPITLFIKYQWLVQIENKINEDLDKM